MSLKVEAAEAIASALYSMAWSEFLGEHDIAAQPDVEAGRAMWFHLGEKPHDIRVTIFRPEEREQVETTVEWYNRWADPRNPLKGEKKFLVSTYQATQSALLAATEKVVLGILEVYKDVLSEEGVAGKIADLAPPESTEGE